TADAIPARYGSRLILGARTHRIRGSFQKLRISFDLHPKPRLSLLRDPFTVRGERFAAERGGGIGQMPGRLVLADRAHSVDLVRIQRAVREILLAVGEDPEREGLRETPDRVARMYAEVFEGLHQDPRGHLKTMFTQKYDEILLVKDIRLVSFCEHHL